MPLDLINPVITLKGATNSLLTWLFFRQNKNPSTIRTDTYT